MSCGIGHRPKLLWLWHRPAAVALIGPLAWESPYAAGEAQEIAKRQKTKNKTKKNKKKLELLAQQFFLQMYLSLLISFTEFFA